MPARRKKYLRKNKAHSKKPQTLLRYLIVLLVIFLLIIFWKSRFWNGKVKFTLAVNSENSVELVTFDPVQEEITIVDIPINTQVDVARQFGTWQIKSVWSLGEDEGLGGRLLAETITRYLKFPTLAWADAPASGFASDELIKIVRAALVPYDSNLKLGDRIGLALFAIRVNNSDRVKIDLAQTSYLRKTQLKDGGLGYLLTGVLSQKIAIIYSDPEISSRGIRVQIKDGTKKQGLAEDVGTLVEVFGAKVASINKLEDGNTDCLVAAKNKELAEKFSTLLDCNDVEVRMMGNFDVEIILGELFAERY